MRRARPVRAACRAPENSPSAAPRGRKVSVSSPWAVRGSGGRWPGALRERRAGLGPAPFPRWFRRSLRSGTFLSAKTPVPFHS